MHDIVGIGSAPRYPGGNGEEPDGLSLAKLIRSFPEEWSEQRTLFGFEGTRASYGQ